LPTAKLRFQYQTHRGETILNEAETDLAFVDAASGKPMRCPAEIIENLSQYFTAD
jgi:acyl-CoA thioesterase FadM